MLQIVPDAPPDPVSAEADHRIANHLSLISSMLRLQIRALESQEFSQQDARLLIEDCGRRIETVARVHRLLSSRVNRGAPVDIRDYLREVAEGVVAGTAVRGAHALRAEGESGCRVRANAVAPMGLLVGELVTNAVKYAHPAGVDGTIVLRCSSDARNSAVVTVADDGVGLPEGLDPDTSGNIGFRMIRSLIQKLEGAVEFDSSCLGLSVTIRIPRA